MQGFDLIADFCAAAADDDQFIRVSLDARRVTHIPRLNITQVSAGFR